MNTTALPAAAATASKRPVRPCGAVDGGEDATLCSTLTAPTSHPGAGSLNVALPERPVSTPPASPEPSSGEAHTLPCFPATAPVEGSCPIVFGDSVAACTITLANRAGLVVGQFDLGVNQAVGARNGDVLVHWPADTAAPSFDGVVRVQLGSGATGACGWIASCSFRLSVTATSADGGPEKEARSKPNITIVFLPDGVWRDWRLPPTAAVFVPSSLLLSMDAPLVSHGGPGSPMELRPLLTKDWRGMECTTAGAGAGAGAGAAQPPVDSM